MTDKPKKGWFQRLSEGLSRSSKQMTEQVVSTFVKEPLSEEALEQLEEHLIESDLAELVFASWAMKRQPQHAQLLAADVDEVSGATVGERDRCVDALARQQHLGDGMAAVREVSGIGITTSIS